LTRHRIIKRFAEELSIPLTDIINIPPSVRNVLAMSGKLYNTCPIPKSNPCTVIDNIRPIAITSIFSKIQESYALEWMLDDAKDNISRRQFGGIPGSSPILALLEMLHNWYSAMENPDPCYVFGLYYKAFDLIDHIIFFDLILKTTIRSIKMYDSEVERVTSFKLLGTWFDDNLKWDSNTEYIAKKARKRLYFLKLLKRYGAPTHAGFATILL
jgi:hypothetical protein